MLNRRNTGNTWLGALALSLVIGLQAPGALGQTATDLVCGGCVQGSDIANGTIGPNKLIPGSINATTIANQSIGPNKLIPGSINTATIATNAIGGNKVLDGSLTGADIANGTIAAADIANGAVGFAKLDGDVQTRVEDLEQQLDALINPADCTNQTLNGTWQAYALHADELADRAGWERCEFTVSNNSVTAGGTCSNQLGDNFSIVSGGFTITSLCVATANLNFSGIFGSASIVHATLDRSRNLLAGVGSATDVGPLAVTVLRR